MMPRKKSSSHIGVINRRLMMVRGFSFMVKNAIVGMMIKISNEVFKCCPPLHPSQEENKTIDGMPKMNIWSERFSNVVLSAKDFKYAVNSVIMNDRIRYIVIVFGMDA